MSYLLKFDGVILILPKKIIGFFFNKEFVVSGIQTWDLDWKTLSRFKRFTIKPHTHAHFFIGFKMTESSSDKVNFEIKIFPSFKTIDSLSGKIGFIIFLKGINQKSPI